MAGDDEQGGGGPDGGKPKAASHKGSGKSYGKPGYGKHAYGKKPGYRPGPRGPGGRPGPRRDPRNAPEDGVAVIYGWHPGLEALRNPQRKIRKLLATENAVNRLTAELGSLPVSPELVAPREIDGLLTPDAVHQGIYIEADPLDHPGGIDGLGADALVLVLDQITDPHNVGAIVRSAAAFGVTAIVTTARHSPAATGVLAKSASGGLEHVPFVTVRNLGDALVRLGENGFWRIGLDSDGAEDFDTLTPRLPLALVLGAEGKGLRQRTRACCDVVARLDMPGVIKSLNVSNAAAVTLHTLTHKLARGSVPS